ncbi:MAG: DEAD/DEAH box helicase, partial [Deltaproteobacteria bacterium]|nr:DEAD/DEAH box helicase [Deltaproteobacteria bacterium]
MSKKTQKEKTNQTVLENGIERFEFYRNGIALLPESKDQTPGVAVMIVGDKLNLSFRFCSCKQYSTKSCEHIIELPQVYRAYMKKFAISNLEEDFKKNRWYRIARVMANESHETPATIQLQCNEFGDEKVVNVFDSKGNEILSYLADANRCERFVGRCSLSKKNNKRASRDKVIKKLARLTITNNERAMLDRGLRTRGLAFRESFWYRFAYHAFRESGRNDCRFKTAVDERNGSFVLTCTGAGGDQVFRMDIPRLKVKELLSDFNQDSTGYEGVPTHPVPLKTVFCLSLNKQQELEIVPHIRFEDKTGGQKLYESESLKPNVYGTLIYIEEKGVFGELEHSDRTGWIFKDPEKKVIEKAEVPDFLEKFGNDLRKGPYLLDNQVKNLKIFKQYDKIEITLDAIEREWTWISLEYRFGNTDISLQQLFNARQKGKRFIETKEGWIDLHSKKLEELKVLPDLGEAEIEGRKDHSLKMSKIDLIRFCAISSKLPKIKGQKNNAALLNNILELKSITPLPQFRGMTSRLREYQKIGVEWLWFLYENGFGGLLCDDMGLGKTHQIMAFMLCLHENGYAKDPFLVVCPTTVLSHWQRKIIEHAPGLNPVTYHGGERNLKEAMAGCKLLLTSYGVMRRDIEMLEKINFSIAVFDEIQHVKNSNTLGYGAAKNVKAAIKLGLTGTPIENALTELKSLMDLTVPNYLGRDTDFITRYVDPIKENLNSPRRKELNRLIAPFTLRRMKKTVLKELPEKIEDIMLCRLSEDQIGLYRDAISSRAKGFMKVLEDGIEPVPYIHVFALLTLLKQICDHPALVENKQNNYDRYQSGKWDLFKELLSEGIDSGQKIVVYSQFLGMIEIIRKHLEALNIGFVVLTGSSRKRGELIERFNEDPDCRVFVGSLKAGGVGIDLVAASIVIHYDRWWNAAKEDQATDRVHRIGQQRGVQVFKLVTEGTLEEKISAIIMKKKDLMEHIVKEDDPGLLKTFSREDIL